MTALERFMAKVDKSDGCWLWKGAVGSDEGYGMFWLDGRMVAAHRAAWILFRGPIPDDRQLDHLCRVRRCVRAEHLEVVSQAVNVLRGEGACALNARKATCPKGHEFIAQRGRRVCRTCANEANRRYREKRAAA